MTLGGKVFALIPRWGKQKLLDKDGKKYDLKRAIQVCAKKGGNYHKAMEVVNEYRRKKGKPPYPV